MHRLLACFAVIALALAASAARASASATVDMTGLQLHLVDLDPTDGIAPAVTFDPGGGSSFASATGGYGADAVFAGQWGTTAFSSVAAAAGPVGGVNSAISLDGDILGSGLTAHGSAHITSQSFAVAESEVALFSSGPAGDFFLPFTLSAHTELVISGVVSGAVAVDDTNHDVARAEMSLLLTGPFMQRQPEGQEFFELVVGGDDGPVTSASAQQDMLVSMSNDSDDGTFGTFVGFVRAATDNGPSAVPSVDEPGSAGLLLAGVAAVAGLARAKGARGRA